MSKNYVDDDEDTVDAKKKRRILEQREELDDWEMNLYNRVLAHEITLEDADQLFGRVVRAYLKSVEPILQAGDLSDAAEVYEEADFGAVQIEPPEKLQQPEEHNLEIKSAPPQPKLVTITGVKEVIETKEVAGTWTVQVRDLDSEERRKTITEENARPLSYPVLEEAVRTVDLWLQQVGIGIDTSGGLREFGFEEVEQDD